MGSLVKASRVLWAVPVLALCVSADAVAQTATAPSQRAFKGLFRGDTESEEGGLNLSATFVQAYDDDLTGQSTRASSSRSGRMVGGHVSTASASVNYVRPGDRVTIAANGLAGGYYYPGMADLSSIRYSGFASLGGTFRRLGFDVHQRAAVSPFYSVVVVPGAFDPGQPIDGPPPPTLDLIKYDGRQYETRANVRYELTERTSASVSGSWRKGTSTGRIGDLTHVAGSAQISRRLTKYLGVAAGYGYQEGRYEGVANRTFTSRSIKLGTDFDRPLSRTRRTFLSLSSGATAIEDQRSRRFRMTGSAGLLHHIGRSWSANVAYRRDAQYVDAFAAPFLSDGVSASMSGFLSRRAGLNFQGGYSSGTVGFSSDAAGYSSYHGTVRLNYALTGNTAIYGQYLYYRHDFARDESVIGLPVEVRRNGVRVGLTLWLPLL